MELKVKITYIDPYSGVVKAIIVNIYGWYNLQSAILNNNIPEGNVTKVERVLDATEDNTTDTTIPITN